MTIKKKRKALVDFCNSRKTCEGCVLFSLNCCFGALGDAEVEKSYAIAFGPSAQIELLSVENERLSVENKRQNHQISILLKRLDKAEEQIKAARADAVREFAEELCIAFRTKRNCFGLEGINDGDITRIMRRMTEERQ